MARISGSPTHLFLQGSTYYFRQAVPTGLRQALGKRELRYSLRTGYLKTARVRARQCAVTAKGLFSQLKSGALEHMAFEVLKVYVEDVFRTLLDEHDLAKAADLQDYPKNLEYERGRSEATQVYLKLLLNGHKPEELTRHARTFVKAMGLDLPEESLEFKVLGREVIKHFAQFHEIVSRRAQGDYSFEKTLYPPRPQAPEPPSPVVPAAPVDPDKLIPLSQIIERYCAQRVQVRAWSALTADNTRSLLESLVEVLGDIPIGQIDFKAMRRFKDVLLRLPPNWKKSRLYRDKTLNEVLAMEPKETISIVTLNNLMVTIGTMFNWCIRAGYMDKNYASGLKERLNKRDDEQREAFSPDDLVTMFSAEDYVKDTFLHPYMFWLPLLALHTGARREELCQLYVDDVRQDGGIWVLDINDNPSRAGEKDKKLKTLNSRRLVPLHPVLVEELRFPEFVERVRAGGHERLWPMLKKVRQMYGHGPGQRFADFRKRAGVLGEKLDMHSFRHTFTDHLKQKLVPTELINEIIGHKNQELSLSRYGKQYKSEVLYENVILKLDFGLDFSPLKRSKYVRGES